ncbi:AAA family ATPase [Paraburkholderia sp. A1RI-2L]|uniref:AAA family ATPase n=1 Tax=Paraburkholderia sp. A1RI-2L TaxID=3028367 RepID=UPI003B7CE9FF
MTSASYLDKPPAEPAPKKMATVKANGHDSKPTPAPLRVLFADDIDADMKGPPQVVEDLICRCDVIDFHGPSHSGKTTFAVHLSLCVARGGVFLGKRTRRGAVVYIASESWANVAMRVQGAKNLLANPERLPLAIVREPIDLYGGETGDMLKDAARVVACAKEFAARCGLPVALIVVDTLARSCGDADENSTRDMGIVSRNLTNIAESTDAAVFVVHHTGRSESKHGRGSSVIYSNAEAEISCEHDEGSDVYRVRVNKQRSLGTKGITLAARFDSVELGTDEWGKPRTVPVVGVLESSYSRAA